MMTTTKDASFYWWQEVLRDGTVIVIRAIRPDDRERLLTHFETLSKESRYFRFFGIRRALSDSDLDYFTHLDFVRHVGLAAVVNEDAQARFVGVARYILQKDQPGRAEIAFAILDEYQGHGIGTLLLKHLATIGLEQGVVEFTADTLASNTRMLDMFAHSGFAVH